MFLNINKSQLVTHQLAINQIGKRTAVFHALISEIKATQSSSSVFEGRFFCGVHSECFEQVFRGFPDLVYPNSVAGRRTLQAEHHLPPILDVVWNK